MYNIDDRIGKKPHLNITVDSHLSGHRYSPDNLNFVL